MDSLSQIVLGAAVGEAVLGKKAGNRAMLWGAVAGTIPDLDVLSNLWMNQLDALVFHRGPTHSVFFALLASFPLAWLVHKYYDAGYHRYIIVRTSASVVASLAMIVTAIGMVFLITVIGGKIPGGIAAGSLLLLVSLFTFRLWKNYGNRACVDDINTNFKEWYWLFFLGLFTHAILDCFTTYGTLILYPITKHRVAFNNIAVVDPLWTLPFLAFLIAAAFRQKGDPTRTKLNYLGIGISSIYLIFTIYNKFRVETILKNTIDQQQIQYMRFMTTPSILNNILWSATVESDSIYYVGTYSFFDKEKKFKLSQLPKNHHLVSSPKSDKTIEVLSWFSNGYFNILSLGNDEFQYNDLRFGILREEIKSNDDFIFSFILKKDEYGVLQLVRQKPRPRGIQQERILGNLIQRIKGV